MLRKLGDLRGASGALNVSSQNDRNDKKTLNAKKRSLLRNLKDTRKIRYVYDTEIL